jgi:hypothetical protein
MQFAEINLDALRFAIETAMGPEAVNVIRVLYVNFEKAMNAAYDAGHLDGFFEAEDDGLDIFEDGYDAGHMHGYDLGYSEGAADGYGDAINDGLDADAEANADAFLEPITPLTGSPVINIE